MTKGDVPKLSPYLILAIIPLDIPVALSICLIENPSIFLNCKMILLRWSFGSNPISWAIIMAADMY